VRVCVIAGGVGAARLLHGMQDVVSSTELTAVVNVADDDRICGLAVSPDLDTVVYTCAEAIDPDRGWGLRDETWLAMEGLRRYTEAAGRSDVGWFNLGDRDLGTHLWRTTRLAEGAALSEVTAEIAHAWGLGFRVLPVTDDLVSTRLRTVDRRELAFQEYFVRDQHDVSVDRVRFVGAEAAAPAPGVIAAIESADAVVIAPSNPVVSIGPVLAVPGVSEALTAARERCVAVSPIIGGRALKGPADRLLAELGGESSARGVAEWYREVASAIVVDHEDAALAPAIEEVGLRCHVTATVMTDRHAAARLARDCIATVTVA
jgi:LPPG:FO 2-phospho-L-lactate transferase